VAKLRLTLIAVVFIKSGKLIICAIIDLPGRLLIRQVRGFIILFTEAYQCIVPRASLLYCCTVHSDALFLSDYSEGIKFAQTKKTGRVWRMIREIRKEPEGMLALAATGFLVDQLMVSR
jgi:hypothetical protein